MYDLTICEPYPLSAVGNNDSSAPNVLFSPGIVYLPIVLTGWPPSGSYANTDFKYEYEWEYSDMLTVPPETSPILSISFNPNVPSFLWINDCKKPIDWAETLCAYWLKSLFVMFFKSLMSATPRCASDCKYSILSLTNWLVPPNTSCPAIFLKANISSGSNAVFSRSFGSTVPLNRFFKSSLFIAFPFIAILIKGLNGFET